jgi:hypothetical protein
MNGLFPGMANALVLRETSQELFLAQRAGTGAVE